MRLALAQKTSAKLREAIGFVIVGQNEVVDQTLWGLLAGGHVLLEGAPGLGKTLLVRTLASCLDLKFSRIQFTPDLMPSDVTGVNVLRDPARGFEFQPGPIFTDLLLGDEINRAPAKTQSALLEAMAERQVTVDGVSRPLGESFTVFATQNPVEHEGTYPLPEAQLDRFLVKTVMPYPTREAELELLARYENGFDAERLDASSMPAALAPADAVALRHLVDSVRVAPEVRVYVADITRSTREERMLSLGASPRATVALFRAARAAAVLEGRDFVTPDDVKGVTPAVLRHRINLAPELEVEGRSTDDVLDALLARVRVPE
ncbi:MAG: AAA family ATPase [Polyangiales bacterium]